MVVLVYFGLVVNVLFEFGILVLVEEPFENSLLDLLIVFVFEEFVTEEFNGSHDEQLATLGALVEGTDRSIWGE